MEIRDSARKHDHSDVDILHAARHVIAEFPGTDQVLILIGCYTSSGTLLEIGLADPYSEDPYIVHCMDLRPKFRRLLPEGDAR
ncbi:MAG: hypothetical protein WKF96_17095 [Solirubrobacteraceae bacterium]